jgi:hypothetical protein
MHLSRFALGGICGHVSKGDGRKGNRFNRAGLATVYIALLLGAVFLSQKGVELDRKSVDKKLRTRPSIRAHQGTFHAL